MRNARESNTITPARKHRGNRGKVNFRFISHFQTKKHTWHLVGIRDNNTTTQAPSRGWKRCSESWKCWDSLVTIPPAWVQTPVWEFTAVLDVRRKHDTVTEQYTVYYIWALTHTHTSQSCQWQGILTQRNPWCWSHRLPTAPDWHRFCSRFDWLRRNKEVKSVSSLIKHSFFFTILQC